jgi:hypothetical protein
VGQLFAAVVLADLQGRGHVRQRSLKRKSTFVTFGAAKVKGNGQERVLNYSKPQFILQ